VPEGYGNMGSTYAFPLSDSRKSCHWDDSRSQCGCHLAVSDSTLIPSALDFLSNVLAHRKPIRGRRKRRRGARRRPTDCRLRPRITLSYAHVVHLSYSSRKDARPDLRQASTCERLPHFLGLSIRRGSCKHFGSLTTTKLKIVYTRCNYGMPWRYTQFLVHVEIYAESSDYLNGICSDANLSSPSSM